MVDTVKDKGETEEELLAGALCRTWGRLMLDGVGNSLVAKVVAVGDIFVLDEVGSSRRREQGLGRDALLGIHEDGDWSHNNIFGIFVGDEVCVGGKYHPRGWCMGHPWRRCTGGT